MRALTIALALAASSLAAPAAAAVFTFEAILDGSSEAPPNASPGTGFARVVFDDVAQTMSVQAQFQDLIGLTTAAHIHGPTPTPGTGTAPVMTSAPSFPGFPLGVTSGSFSNVFDMLLTTSYNPGFLNNATNLGSVATASNTMLTAMRDGKAYFNIHTPQYPGGEIRGFLTAVPEPETWALMIAGFGMTGAMLRSRRRPEVRAAR